MFLAIITWLELFLYVQQFIHLSSSSVKRLWPYCSLPDTAQVSHNITSQRQLDNTLQEAAGSQHRLFQCTC